MWTTIKNIFYNHWQVKCLALAIAVSIWFYANTRLKEETILWVPVKIETPEGYRLLHQSHHHVQVRFLGPQYLIQRRQEEAGQNYLEFSTMLTGEDIRAEIQSFEVRPEWLNIPDSDLAMMNVIVLDPVDIDLLASPVSTQNLPVEADFSGRPRRGYKMTGHTVTPSEVSVEAPRLVLDRMEAVKTRSFSIWDAHDSDRRYVPLVNETQLTINGIEFAVPYTTSPSQVAVHISIDQMHMELKMEGLPLKLLRPLGFPYHAEIPEEESRVNVSLSGRPDALERISEEHVTAYVDLSNLEDEEIQRDATAPYKQTVQILLEPGIEAEVDLIVPDQVTVLLSHE